MMRARVKPQFQKKPLEIVGIGETTERKINIILKDGRHVPIRRDLVEIYGNRAFVPKWLADRIIGEN